MLNVDILELLGLVLAAAMHILGHPGNDEARADGVDGDAAGTEIGGHARVRLINPPLAVQ